MTKFEQIGVSIQCDAPSIRAAVKSFRNSCYICCTRGMYISCDKCSIAEAHKQVVATFNDMKEVKHETV